MSFEYFCPHCSHPLNYYELKNGFCQNCRLTFDKDLFGTPHECQSKEEGICRLPMNTCKQCKIEKYENRD